MKRPTVRAFVGKHAELRLRSTGERVDIVRVVGAGLLWDRKYMVVPVGSPAGTEPRETNARNLLIFDTEKQQEQSPYERGRNLSHWLGTFHERGLDGHGCFQMTGGGGFGSNYSLCGNPAKLKVDAGDPAMEKILPMMAVPHGYKLDAYYCGLHDPIKRHEKRVARDNAWRDKWRREEDEDKRRAREEKELKRKAGLYDELVAALVAIADGEGGDPQELARAALVTAKVLKDERTA